MNVEQFIRETLVQIVKGIESANSELSSSSSNAIVNPQYYSPDKMEYDTNPNNSHWYSRKVSIIEFDVAVYANEGTETQGGIGILVGTIGIGTKGKSDASHSTESRIKFEIPIVLPNPKL